MRIAIFAIAGLQVLYLILVNSGTTDPAGSAMSGAFVTLAALFAALFLIPAVVLAIRNRGLGLGLFLALIPAIGLVVVLPSL